MDIVARLRIVAAVGVVTAGVLTGCAGSTAPGAVCVPELTVVPSDPHPGMIVTVTTSRACPVTLPDGVKWKVRIQPEDAVIPLAQATVRPDDDGSFTVSITVPPTMPGGAAIVSISNYWDYVPCPDGVSCASAEGRFIVGQMLP